MSKATETINHEYFGNLSIKGIKEIEVNMKPVSMAPKTWGWSVLSLIAIGLIFYYIYKTLLYYKKYGAYVRVYKGLSNDDTIQDIYLLYKKISKLRFDYRIDDSFLINSAIGEYSLAEQESLNKYLYYSLTLEKRVEESLKKRMLYDIGLTLKDLRRNHD
ncbi:hypothetical protein M902_3103 [Bacteriovorax sp. BAL6_X]|uniref:hypothetical protein n=1 Tax=Bacteriovorax sp. BAL6_X TaxID=1201290 RepID=UPI000385CB4C|nr:hypothetical protein [Bacteriovorax sp. BAL6_X]EPZ50759.1 hypothetical protein M902_3103 [Bacteriovorax sp. BAL6_X]